MGTYIYAVRQKSVDAVWSYGAPAKVHMLTYLAKVFMHYMDIKRNDKKIVQVARQWSDVGVDDCSGMLVIEAKKAVAGAPVIKYRYKSPTCLDTDSFGEVVGHLHKVGRKWVIVPVQGQVG